MRFFLDLGFKGVRDKELKIVCFHTNRTPLK